MLKIPKVEPLASGKNTCPKIERLYVYSHSHLVQGFVRKRGHKMKIIKIFEKSALGAQGHEERQPWFNLPED